jgi:hypothetical protein
VLLGLCAIQPFLEAIDILCIFVQQIEIFIYDFVAALQVCEGQLYTLYVDRGTAYGRDELWVFCGLLDCSRDSIY